MKLKHQDKRPKKQFSVGDIVDYGNGRSIGLIISIDPPEKDLQKCYCIFAAKEFDLRLKAKQSVQTITRGHIDPINQPSVAKVYNNQLHFVKLAPKDWLQPLSSSEILLLRFTNLLDE